MLTRLERCTECDGSGEVRQEHSDCGGLFPCKRCDGFGTIEIVICCSPTHNRLLAGQTEANQ